MPPWAGFPRAVTICPDINASYWSLVKECISLKDGNVASFRGDFLGECRNSEGSGGRRDHPPSVRAAVHSKGESRGNLRQQHDGGVRVASWRRCTYPNTHSRRGVTRRPFLSHAIDRARPPEWSTRLPLLARPLGIHEYAGGLAKVSCFA